MATYNGIDVSKHQGAIDWGRVKQDFAFIRVGFANSDGTITEDTYFKTNMQGAAAAGIPVGVYLYSYLQDAAAAKRAAENVLQMVKGYRLEMPLVFDFEENKRNSAKLIDDNTDIILAALRVWEQAEYYAMYYTYKSFAEYALDLDRLQPFDCWIAHYTAAPLTSYKGPFGIWQYSSKGSVPGIVGNVDLNKAYKDYPAIIRKAGLNRLNAVDIVFDDITAEQAEKIQLFAYENGIPCTRFGGV